MLTVTSLLLLTQTSVCWSKAISRSGKTEFNYYYDGQKWNPSWFQCDRAQDVVIFLKPAASTSQALLRLTKPTAATTTYSLTEMGPSDCAMMKCWWKYKGGSSDAYFVVQESHYYDFAGGFWSRQHQLGEGQTEATAQDKMEDCRWFSRLRLAVLTATDSYYVTESASGKLLLRAFNYKNSEASISIVGGVSRFDSNRRSETFTFHQADQNFVFVVGRIHPGVIIQLIRGDHLRRVQAVSYTHVQKH